MSAPDIVALVLASLSVALALWSYLRARKWRRTEARYLAWRSHMKPLRPWQSYARSYYEYQFKQRPADLEWDGVRWVVKKRQQPESSNEPT